MPRPRDVVVDKPQVLFVGINPSLTSGKVGHHFAGPANPFWQLLHAAGFTPTLFTAAQDHDLAPLGYALLNLCPRPTKMASELGKRELELGKKSLIEKVRAMQPKLVALVGVTLYPLLFARTRPKPAKGKLAAKPAKESLTTTITARKDLVPGPGLKPETIEGARVYVLPNPSGLNISFPSFASKLPWFEALKKVADGS